MAMDNDKKFYYESKNSKQSSPVQGISWRELQAAIFATTRSRQYRSCMEITYITTRKKILNARYVKTTFDRRRPDCHCA
jgi:hypothetical protein